MGWRGGGWRKRKKLRGTFVEGSERLSQAKQTVSFKRFKEIFKRTIKWYESQKEKQTEW